MRASTTARPKISRSHIFTPRATGTGESREEQKMSARLLTLVVATLLLAAVNAVYFTITTERNKCFTFEQPKDTPIVFSYEILDAEHEVQFTLYYGSLAVDELLIMRKEFHRATGHVDFTSDNDGAYSVCVQQLRATYPDGQERVPTRMRLSIIYGYDTEYYEKLQKKQHFEAVNLEVHKLNDMMSMALNEADFMKHKEVEYHDSTERMNTAGLWWPMGQIGILVIMGIFQVQHLKSFFKNHKII